MGEMGEIALHVLLQEIIHSCSHLAAFARSVGSHNVDATYCGGSYENGLEP